MMPPDPFAQRYTKLRLVGRGGFGAVYRASDTDLDREVALKLLNPDLAGDADWRRRFRQEATAASKLNHPNITIVFDRGEYEDQPYIVMEFVEGETLSKVIERGALSDYERISLLEQLCDGLHYAHQRDIVHRDIKPVNLIVREDDDGTHRVRTLKILDFGIAKVLNSGQTATGGMMFTPNYVSPEHVLGEEVDRRGDIFAVGAVAYELLVGEKAFVISSKNPFTVLEEVKRKIVQEPHRPMTDLRPDLDPELCAIVDRALAKAPGDRYRDLADMKRRLRRVRERLEDAIPDSSEPTITLGPKLQSALRLARQALDAGDATSAVHHLQDALASATTDWERQFLQEPLAEALGRQAAISAERRAHDEAAAQAAINMAKGAFVEGDRTAAIRALGQFEPQDRVAEQLALLLKADGAIAAAERLVESGDVNARAAAIAQLGSFAPADLFAPALVRLQRRADERLATEQRTAAAEKIARAHTAFKAGRRDDAIATLRAFEPAGLVTAALGNLRDALTAIEAAVRAVHEGAPDTRNRALAELQAFSPPDLVAVALSDLRAQADERTATEQRDQEEAAADRASAVAYRRFASGVRAEAIAELEAFPDPSRVATALDRLREAATAIETAEAQVRQGDRGARSTAIARLAQFPEGALISAPLEALKTLDAELRFAEDHDAAASAAIGEAKQLFATQREAAIGRLEAFAPPHPAVHDALGELRITAERLDAAEQKARAAQEQAEWADAADRAVLAAHEAFAANRREEALAALKQFPRTELVAEAVAELGALNALVERVAARIATSAAADREHALDELAAASSSQLLQRPLAALRQTHAERSAEETRLAEAARAQEELFNRARAIQAEARQALVAGETGRAIEMLEGFTPPEPVASTLAAFRDAIRAIEDARISITAEGAAAAARRAALDQLSRREPRDLFERALAELRVIDQQRTAAEAKAEAERIEAEARENLARQKARAEQAATAARAQFVEGAYDRAIQSLAEFQPPDLVAEMSALLRSVKATIAQAYGVVERADSSGRLRAIATLQEFQPGDLVAAAVRQLQTEHERREAVERQAAIEKQANERAERTASDARRLHEAGKTAAAIDLLTAAPAHRATTALLEDLRITVQMSGLLERAASSLDTDLAGAAAAIEQARRLRPDDTRVNALALQIASRRRAVRMQAARRLAVRLAPAVVVIALAVAGYSLWPFGGTTPAPQIGQAPGTGTGDTGAPTARESASVPADSGSPSGPTPPVTTPARPPAAVPTMVTIDAKPWARFSITPAAGDSGQQPVSGLTPARVELLPGSYSITLQSDGVAGPLTGTLIVGTSPLSKEYPMTGFNADRAVDAILGPERRDEVRR